MKYVLTIITTLFAVWLYQSFNEYLAASEQAAVDKACRPAVELRRM